jgi:hypothetical protein
MDPPKLPAHSIALFCTKSNAISLTGNIGISFRIVHPSYSHNFYRVSTKVCAPKLVSDDCVVSARQLTFHWSIGCSFCIKGTSVFLRFSLDFRFVKQQQNIYHKFTIVVCETTAILWNK